MGFIPPEGVLMLPEGRRPEGSIQTPEATPNLFFSTKTSKSFIPTDCSQLVSGNVCILHSLKPVLQTVNYVGFTPCYHLINFIQQFYFTISGATLTQQCQ